MFKPKFDESVYLNWIDNMLSNVNNYYLVVYTDKDSFHKFTKYINNKNIKFINKPIENFYNYKYKDKWINNHKNNHLLNEWVDWKVNMLWSEKIHFVNETMQNKYFDTEMYGWCDIGYFRNRIGLDLNNESLKYWPSHEKINNLYKDKIHYGLINNNQQFVEFLYKIINNKNVLGLPKQQIPPQQNSIAGGFFILHKNLIQWWKKTYDAKLQLYFNNNYLIKDDQIIIADCIFSDETINNFQLYVENSQYDNWFLFQRILL